MEYNAFSVSLITGLALCMSACGGGGGGASSGSIGGGSPSGGLGVSPAPNTDPDPVSLALDNAPTANRFLARSAFGGSAEKIEEAQDLTAFDWLSEQFAMSYTPMVADMVAREVAGEDLFAREHTFYFWKSAIDGDDQLRQRMIFALSQIIVVSDEDINSPLAMGNYLDILGRHAFGNYRDLLQDITYSPAMADYLTYLRNKKGDLDTGRMPDENYARELLQLFTLGLTELNMDGTEKLDSFGEPIEIYNNSDITGLARVFTGLTLKGTSFWNSDDDAFYSPLIMWADHHSDLEKSFLGQTITAGTPGEQSIEQALDHIFDHPNMAPFFARQLIQRFTASSPSPDYIKRVAEAFESGQFTDSAGTVFGTTGRGDLQATLAAILLDEQFFDDEAATSEDGKLREPVLKFLHWARAFDVGTIDPANQHWLLWNVGRSDRLGQSPFSSKSVFNFYRPGYIAPGSLTGEAGLAAPELQIVNENSVTGFNNFMFNFVFDRTSQIDDTLNGFEPDYSDELLLSDDPEALTEHLNQLLLAGHMGDVTRGRMVDALGLMDIPALNPDDPDNAAAIEDAKLTRVQLAVYMAVVSAEYAVQF